MNTKKHIRIYNSSETPCQIIDSFDVECTEENEMDVIESYIADHVFHDCFMTLSVHNCNAWNRFVTKVLFFKARLFDY